MRLNRPPRARRLAAAAALSLFACGAGAQQPDAENPSADEVRQTIENVFNRIWTPRSRFTDGPHTRRLFRPIIAAAREATVQVRASGKRVAYGGIVGPDGWVLTKASPLRGGVTVRLSGGDAYPARIVGVDRAYDLAMLKIEASGLPTLDMTPLPTPSAAHLVRADRPAAEPKDPEEDSAPTAPLGESAPDEPTASLLPGDWVATIGYGRDPAAIGVVSVLPREIPRRRGLLGIQMGTEASANGVPIDRVSDDSGASRAGIEAGDLLIAVDDAPVTTHDEVKKAISAHYPGDQVVVTVLRGERRLRLRAVLTGQVRDFGVSRSQYQNALGGDLSERRFGFPQALQHDTVLRPEDCGGPLVNLEGRVVGFNIARAGRTESYALPTAAIRDRLYDLMSGRLGPADEPEDDAAPADESADAG